jgi:hypothetical protein
MNFPWYLGHIFPQFTFFTFRLPDLRFLCKIFFSTFYWTNHRSLHGYDFLLTRRGTSILSQLFFGEKQICFVSQKLVGNRIARFFLKQCTKTEKIYQTDKKLPHDHKIYQMALIYSKWAYNIPTWSILRPSKFTQNGILCLKIYHLAPLVGNTTNRNVHTSWLFK